MWIFAEMANKTIYGCYNSSTGAVNFVMGNYCYSCPFTGCYVASGEHEGQIAVTVAKTDCNDTYYGCLNTSTGNFQLVVPEECCPIGIMTDYVGEYCGWPVGKVPRYVIVKITGVRYCYDDELAPFNGCYCPRWFYGVGVWEDDLQRVNNLCNVYTELGLKINEIESGDYQITIRELSFEFNYWFMYEGNGQFHCPDTYANEIQKENCNCPGYTVGYGGYITFFSANEYMSDIESWVIEMDYVFGNVVRYANKIYSCILAHTSNIGNAPPNQTYWIETDCD